VPGRRRRAARLAALRDSYRFLPHAARAQCAHLLVMSRRPHAAIQVIPDSKGAACAYGQQFMILTFKSRAPLAYLEDMRGARYVRERDEVGTYSMAFDFLRASALDDEQSGELIRGVMNERYV
jgi:hypothetical protein